MMQVYDKKEECYGCTACKHICNRQAIIMEEDKEGFKYPIINESLCNKCGLCRKICPFKSDYKGCLTEEYPKVYAVKHRLDEVRETSTSGGMFTAISDYILSKKGIVYGATFDNNFIVCHERAETKQEVLKFKGSKYVQSDLNNIFKQIKEDILNDRYVLFTGTPCQTAGLYRYLGQRINKSRLYVCDIVCHGTPSPLIWKEYIQFLKNKYNDKIINIEFKNKVLGWRKPSLKVKMEKNEYCTYHGKDYYYRLFYSKNILRPSCHKCKYASLNRPSDITLGDFWGIENSKPYMDDDKGISLVIINSEKGNILFDNIKSELIYEKSNTVECLQPNLKSPTQRPCNREQFWNDYESKGFEYILKKYTPYGLKKRIEYEYINPTKKNIKIILKKLGIRK